MIRTSELRKRYAAQEVLRGVSLEVEEGEIFGFVGPNGAGKSTFLKCLTGVVRPTSGQIRVGAVDAVGDSLAARRLIGYAPSDTAMYDHLRAGAMLDFCVSFHPDGDRERGRELLERFEVPERRKVGRLSFGMKRKVLIAQAIATGAPALLLDEPMEGLDPEARRDLHALLREEAASGRTVFFSSHDLASVEKICHRVAFLRQGELLECNTVEAVLERASHTLWVRLREPREPEELPMADELLWRGEDTRWRLEFRGELEDVLPHLEKLPLAQLRDAAGSLDDVFDALYGPAPPRAEEHEAQAATREDAS